MIDHEDTLIPVLVIMLIGACLFVGINYGLKTACENSAEVMQREYRFSASTGCMLRSDSGRFLPIEAFRAVEGE